MLRRISCVLILGVWILAWGGAARGSTQETLKVLPTGAPDIGDNFGSAVALDGNTAVIGATQHTVAASFSGAAYIVNATTGQELFQLATAQADRSDNFGFDVAIDGGTVIVGANRKDALGDNSGAAYLFDAATGQQLHELLPLDGGEGDEFGCSVDISGNRAIVGAHWADEGGIHRGAAYIFDVTTGQQVFKLVDPAPDDSDYFGDSVAIDGNYAAVGADRRRGVASDTGAVYVYDVTTGQQLMELTASDAAQGDYFGGSVAISGDRLIVGAPGEDYYAMSSGSAYLFDLVTGQELFKLGASDPGQSDSFGLDVDIAGDLAIAGAQGESDGGDLAGAAYVFDLLTGRQVFKLTASDADPLDFMGGAVGLSGHTAIVGAVGDDEAGQGAGAAYVYGPLDPPIFGDVDGDGDRDADDIDALCDHLGGALDPYDVDDDGDVDENDLIYLVELLVETDVDGDGTPDGNGTHRGDFNLDGVVNATDLQIMNSRFGQSGVGWADGNTNCDDVINTTDLAILQSHFGSAAAGAPEPATLGLLAVGAMGLNIRRQRGQRARRS